MKHVLLLILATCISIADPTMLNSQSSGQNVTGSLLVLITGCKITGGHIMVAVFNGPSGFPDKNPLTGAIRDAKSTEVLIRFDDLPYGEYAIVAIHDVNDDGQLDKNFLGIPTEGYGFSNNPPKKHGPPSFVQSSFQFSASVTVKVIELQYGL